MEPTLVLPIVHFNGTSAETLRHQRENVYFVLQQSLEVMRGMSPNGRDYYLEPGRLEKAEEQHARRCRTIAALMDEIETEIGELDKHCR